MNEANVLDQSAPELLEPELLSPESLIITDDQLRGSDRAAVDELVADVLNDLAGYIRECNLLLEGRTDDFYDDVEDEPLSDPEQRRRATALRAALESWQQAWRAADQLPVGEQDVEEETLPSF